VIALIRASQTPDEAREGLMTQFGLSELQARAILDMRLQRLTGLERDKIRDEHAELMKLITYLRSVLADESLRMGIIKAETLEMKEKYGDKRRTEIVTSGADLNMEDLIADDAVVVTISHLGYIKRTALNEFRTQGRGGVGSRGSTTRDEDFLEHLFVATNHNYLLIFTQKGRCFWMRVYDIPEGTRQSKGRAIQNLIQIEGDDKVLAYINVKDLKNEEYLNNHFVVLCTKNGVIKKTTLEAYSRPRSNGIIAVGIREGDELLEARLTNGNSHIIMASREGKANHFEESRVRPMGRGASGVRGMSLEDGDEVVGMITIDQAETATRQVLVVSETGYGKRSPVDDYRITNRGGKGVKTLQVTDRTGKVIAIKDVTDEDQLMIINRSGITIRTRVSELRVLGRATQGVRLIELREKDRIAAVAKVDSELSEEEEPEEGAEGPAPDAPENGTEVDNGTPEN
jgi:DNA gyrase subunit A